jgi:hypothetical protein
VICECDRHCDVPPCQKRRVTPIDRLVRNVYKVPLTRGITGIVIYSAGQETCDAPHPCCPVHVWPRKKVRLSATAHHPGSAEADGNRVSLRSIFAWTAVKTSIPQTSANLTR